MTAALINQAVGPYKLRVSLGRGSTSEVFRAEHHSDGRPMAVKILRADRVADPVKVKQFKDEFSLLQRLAHPGVPRAIQLTEVQGRPAILLDFVSGTPLANLTGGADDRSQGDRLYQLATILGYLHGQRVVYQNLHLDHAVQRGDGRVVLLGFSHSYQQSLGRSFTDYFVKRQRPVFASPTYVAPEVLRGGRQTVASDCYALGVCAWLLLVGRAPFTSDNAEQRLREASRGAPSLATEKPQLPRALTSAVNRSLHPDPARRLSDAGELASACRAGDLLHT